jgi:pimeloyl-ACP methyl ester carboxylesterase
MPSVNVSGTTLHYAEQGRGPKTLVLVHGFPLDSRMWDGQREALADAARVIAVDLKGFGKSNSNEPFTINSQAQTLHEALAQINALPCILCGLSMGGYIALAFARKFPKDLQALMLVDTRAEGDTTEGKANRDKMIELVRKDGSTAVADQMMGKMLSPDTVQHRPQVVRELRDIMENCPPRTIENALVALRDRDDQTSLLPSIAVPTLILVGQDDAITPPAVAEAMHHSIPNSQLQIIQGAGHMSPMEQPEQVTQAMRRFVQALQTEKK